MRRKFRNMKCESYKFWDVSLIYHKGECEIFIEKNYISNLI